MLWVDALCSISMFRSRYVFVFQFTIMGEKVIKDVAARNIVQERPVWFGCDVGQFSDSGKGIMDLDVYNYGVGFNTDVIRNMNKADRLTYRESLMTHAMVCTPSYPSYISQSQVLTGVDLVVDAAGTQTANKWRVENSWGEGAGKEGFMVMSDSWFTEYVYQIVVDRTHVPDAVWREFEEGGRETIVLPLWDPLGSLA